MKRIILATGLAALCAVAFAQAPEGAKKPEIAKPSCSPTPEYPGGEGMRADVKRRSFERDLKAYRECMLGYIEERKANATANMDAANSAINEYNTVMKKINEEQERAR